MDETEVPECELKEVFSPETFEKFGEKFWMVQPCEWFKQEYKDCKSLAARFHYHFIHGTRKDCEPLNDEYKLCMQFRKSHDKNLFDRLVKKQEERCNERQQSVIKNDVWEYRTSPPKNWNEKLDDPIMNTASPLLLYEQKKKKQETI